jgi:hypothetical protein
MPATAQVVGCQWWVKLQCHHKGGVAKLLIARDCGGYGGLWWVFQNFFRELPYIGTLRKNPPHPPHLTFPTPEVIARQALVQQWWVFSTHHKPTTTHHNPPLRFFNVSAMIIGVFVGVMARAARAGVRVGFCVAQVIENIRRGGLWWVFCLLPRATEGNRKNPPKPTITHHTSLGSWCQATAIGQNSVLQALGNEELGDSAPTAAAMQGIGARADSGPAAPARPAAKKLAARGPRQARPSVGHNHRGFAILRQQQQSAGILPLLPWALPGPLAWFGLRLDQGAGPLCAVEDLQLCPITGEYVNFPTQYFQQLT